ncbi:MAG: 5-(carboxyamino)imidazole ribonucleotide synthase [Pirellulales bacterium]
MGVDSDQIEPIMPGALLGVLGGGQLGAMFAVAARRMGYRVAVITDTHECPAARHADRLHVGSYDDPVFLAEAAEGLAVVTFEFENVPAAAGEALKAAVPVRPHPEVLFTTQSREREKAFLVERGIPCGRHAVVRTEEDLQQAVKNIGLPAILKTAAFGYDGKGQRMLKGMADIHDAWVSLGELPCVLEEWIDFQCELSVVAARGLDGAVVAFPAIRNEHANHILDVSSCPAELPAEVLGEAEHLAATVLSELGVVGVACVEFFLAKDNRLLVNEIAPRTHNSGHLTIEACPTSQFEQQVRAICGLPLGETAPLAPAAMANLLGDCWQSGEPMWERVFAVPGAGLHLYGKAEPRPGRKMGHITVTANTTDEAKALVRQARQGVATR